MESELMLVLKLQTGRNIGWQRYYRGGWSIIHNLIRIRYRIFSNFRNTHTFNWI
jgi:hypothetical protein